MAKDPAALIYYDHFLALAREMRADCRGWYMMLMLHQFKSGSLPSDIEELANLASVRISEYDMFQQVFQQVLKQRFEQLPNGRLVDIEAAEIIRNRETFKEKRSAAGKISAFIKFIRRELCGDENVIFFIKQHVEVEQISTTDQHVLKHVFEQLLQLYINTNTNNNTNRVNGGMGEKGEEHETNASPPTGWNTFPGEEQLDLEIPDLKLGSAQELMHHSGQDPSRQQMKSLWKIFKVQHFTRKKYYAHPDEVYSHFINWSKTQKVNGTTSKSNRSNGKSAGTTELIEHLGAELAAGGEPDYPG